MTKDVTHLNEHRRKKKPRSLEDTGKQAARRWLDQMRSDIEEPEALASGGDMSKILKDEGD